MPWTEVCQASLSLIISLSLLKLMCFESMMPSNHLILCRPFIFGLQSFPASGSFPMRRLFESGGQRIGASASALVLPMNIQGWFPLGLTGFISLLSKGLSSVFSSTKFKGTNSSALSLLYGSTLISIHDYWKNHNFDWQTYVIKVMSLLFNTLSMLVIAFFPRSKCLSVSSLQSPSAVILEPKK